MNCDYAAAARRASEGGGEACALLRPFAEPKLNRRIERCFDAVCFETSDEAVSAFLRGRPEGSVCVAFGEALAERARRFARGRVLSLSPGGDIELPSAAMADTVAALVYDTIRKSAAPGHHISDVLEDDTEQKVILTPEQEERLLAFMETDKIYSKYYDEIVLLLETGLRISEFCGLTTHIDMQNRILNIDHQLLKDSEIGYYIETPKTKNGKRELPLTERAYQGADQRYFPGGFNLSNT